MFDDPYRRAPRDRLPSVEHEEDDSQVLVEPILLVRVAFAGFG